MIRLDKTYNYGYHKEISDMLYQCYLRYNNLRPNKKFDSLKNTNGKT